MPNLDEVRAAYKASCGFSLLQTDRGGAVVAGKAGFTDCRCRNASGRRRIQAAEQTLYWGETIIKLCCDDGYAMWAVPVRENNATTGALLVQGIDLEGGDGEFYRRVQEAANGLLELALEANLLPAAEVQVARQRALLERERFLAIEAGKDNTAIDDLRGIYLREEPRLLTAIKEGRNREARSILNQVLTGIYGLASERMELLKSCVLELVVMMNRAAVEAGAQPASVLGRNYQSLVDLSKIQDEEELSDWVRRMLEILMEGIRANDAYPHSLLLLRAARYMQSHLHEHLRRDEVARIAGVSPSHFSRLVAERAGQSYSQLLTQMRVNRAKELLRNTELSLSEIAMECGFCDQSHFNKVFRSIASASPGTYRKRVK